MSLSKKQEHLLQRAFENVCGERMVYPNPLAESGPAPAILREIHAIAGGTAKLPVEEEKAASPMFVEFRRLAHFEGGDDGQPFEAWLAEMENKLPPHPGFP